MYVNRPKKVTKEDAGLIPVPPREGEKLVDQIRQRSIDMAERELMVREGEKLLKMAIKVGNGRINATVVGERRGVGDIKIGGKSMLSDENHRTVRIRKDAFKVLLQSGFIGLEYAREPTGYVGDPVYECTFEVTTRGYVVVT